MGTQHTISLSKEQSDYSRTMPNFSAFVQECLRLHSVGELNIDLQRLNLRKKELQRVEYVTMIENRLENIEKLLVDALNS